MEAMEKGAEEEEEEEDSEEEEDLEEEEDPEEEEVEEDKVEPLHSPVTLSPDLMEFERCEQPGQVASCGAPVEKGTEPESRTLQNSHAGGA